MPLPSLIKFAEKVFVGQKSKNQYPHLDLLLNGTNVAVLLTLLASAFLETGLSKADSSQIQKVSKVADLGNRFFQISNSVRNLITLIPNRDYLSSLGHLFDVIIPFFSKGEDYFISRGIALGNYVLGRGFNIINSKDKFSSWADYKSHIKLAWTKIQTKLFGDWRNLGSNLMKHEFALLDVISGLLSNTAVLLWKPLELLLGETGRKIAVVLVDLGRFCQAFESMKIGHLKSGRLFMFSSGYAQVLGAITHLLGETSLKPFKKVCDPLSFAFSAVNRWCQSISNQRGEAGG